MDLRSDLPVNSQDGEQLSSLPNGAAVAQLLKQQKNITVSTSGEVSALQGPLAVALYRILQECITNISKYAPADTATITLNVGATDISLSSQNTLPAGASVQPVLSGKTLGLISMRERVTSLGGVFTAGAEGHLWKVSCKLPRHD